jgi:hypothetical protein
VRVTGASGHRRVTRRYRNIGYLSGALKHFSDQICYPASDDTKGPPYRCFVHGNLGTDGAVNAIG